MVQHQLKFSGERAERSGRIFPQSFVEAEEIISEARTEQVVTLLLPEPEIGNGDLETTPAIG